LRIDCAKPRAIGLTLCVDHVQQRARAIAIRELRIAHVGVCRLHGLLLRRERLPAVADR